MSAPQPPPGAAAPSRETSSGLIRQLRKGRTGSAPGPVAPAAAEAPGAGPAPEGEAERTRAAERAPGPPGAQPGLLVLSAPDPALLGSFFALDGELVVGRVGDAHIRICDPGISRRHVRVARAPAGGVTVEDLGSTNGTWLNGKNVRSAPLQEGDRLQLGNSTEIYYGALRESAQAEVRLRQAISAAGAGTWEWLAATGVLRLYGGIARAVGKDVDVTRPSSEDCWERVHPEDHLGLRAGLEAALRGGGAFEAEVRLLRQGGQVSWVAMTGEPFRDEAGHVVRLAGGLLDVTERRRAEAELRRHALLFDSLADAVVVVGADGTILDWSAGAVRLLGWTKAEALARRPGALLLPGGAQRFEEDLARCAEGRERCTDELTLRTKSGAEAPVEMVAVPLLDQAAELVACVAVFRDLAERRQLQARLQVAERLASLGTLAAGVAHEINNPLAFVLSNLDYVALQLAKAAAVIGPAHGEVAEALADSRKGAERIASIVRDLCAFGSERPGQPGEVDPNAALEFALRMADGRIRHRACLVKDLRPVPRVQGSEARLGQVFLNLLVNATQAIAPGRAAESVIRVSSRFDAAQRRVVVEVSDGGAGIPLDLLPRIFEPFFTTKPVGAGTGLGLFVCRSIVEELGGEIAVESQLGKGATFRVLLPVAGEAPAPGPERPRVLVVDDEPLLGAALRRWFANRYEVVTATDPREALERIRAGEQFLFALVDLQMPEMSGREFLARLRESAPDLARRSAAITGGAPEDLSEPGAEPPLLLPKPIDMAKLAALVDAAAESERQRKLQVAAP